jgi:hypothetical protein
MRPSVVVGKTSTPSHSSLRPSSGCVACAVHSLTAKSSPQRAALEAQRRPAREDPSDVGPHRCRARDPLPRRVVVEDDGVVVHRRDRIEVLRVPGRIVAIDEHGDIDTSDPLLSRLPLPLAALRRPRKAEGRPYRSLVVDLRGQLTAPRGLRSATQVCGRRPCWGRRRSAAPPRRRSACRSRDRRRRLVGGRCRVSDGLRRTERSRAGRAYGGEGLIRQYRAASDHVPAR